MSFGLSDGILHMSHAHIRLYAPFDWRNILEASLDADEG